MQVMESLAVLSLERKFQDLLPAGLSAEQEEGVRALAREFYALGHEAGHVCAEAAAPLTQEPAPSVMSGGYL